MTGQYLLSRKILKSNTNTPFVKNKIYKESYYKFKQNLSGLHSIVINKTKFYHNFNKKSIEKFKLTVNSKFY